MSRKDNAVVWELSENPMVTTEGLHSEVVKRPAGIALLFRNPYETAFKHYKFERI
jgi:hypothetical protein